MSATAHGFAEVARFDTTVAEGGGGGRWFTGSPADGYGCAVCHVDAKPMELTIFGIPEKYAPQTVYEIELRWPADLEHVSAFLEFTDQRGARAGALELPPGPVLTDEEICRPKEQGVRATQILEATEFLGTIQFASLGTRQLASFNDCGATRLRFRWKAPVSDIGPVLLAGGIVAANEKPTFDQKDVYKDSTAQIFLQLPGPSSPPRMGSGGCTLMAEPASLSASALGWGSFLILLFLRRFHKRQQLTPASSHFPPNDCADLRALYTMMKVVVHAYGPRRVRAW